MIASKNFTKILIIILILIGICYGFYSYQDLFTNENKVIEIQEMNNIVVSSINPELINTSLINTSLIKNELIKTELINNEVINTELIKEQNIYPSKKKILIGLLGFIGVVVFIGFLKGPLYLLTPFYSVFYINFIFN
jgi:multisubunit Na+/H+ antiporter MnhF subunit